MFTMTTMTEHVLSLWFCWCALEKDSRQSVYFSSILMYVCLCGVEQVNEDR